jgi:hypothetical protein
MRLTELHSDSLAGSCPTVYQTDDGRLVVQGDVLTDPEARSDLRDVLDGEGALVVPRELILRAAAKLTG